MTTPSNDSCCAPVTHLESAIAFPSNQRPHISINVPNLAEVRPFYQALLGENPVRELDDYIKWEPLSPPCNFTLNKHPEELMSSENLGIEVDSSAGIDEIVNRLEAIGVQVIREDSAALAVDAYGNRWEITHRVTA